MPLIRASDLPPYVPRERRRDSNPDGHRLTWDELVAREPRLAELRRRIAAVRAGPDFCANHLWYGRRGFKAEMAGLVGMHAESDDAALGTAAAYDVAYHTLYELLPDCRHDGWCRGGRQ